jgi:3'(2'), 5'-bisphosphate nucleotidase
VLLRQNITIAIQAAIKAGKEIFRIYKDPKSDFFVEIKSDNSPLTIADKAAHNIIVRELEKTGIPILSEEGKTIPYVVRKHWKTFWLIDPLDGTKEFIKKNNEFTVNIALIESGNPITGVIYVPVSKELYIGDIKTGAWKYKTIDEEISLVKVMLRGIRLPKNIQNNAYYVVGSRSHMSHETEHYIKELKNKHKNIEIVSKGSSLKICMVAEGLANEYPRFGPTMEWDTAAGHAIANAAGKKLLLTDFSGELVYNKKNLLNPYFIVK